MMLMTEAVDLSSVFTFVEQTVFPTERDLSVYLDIIWQRYFSDITRADEVTVAYSYPWKTRLGLIRMSLDSMHTFIGINALLQHATTPSSVLITTVAHELVHYVHGFGSPLPRRYEHPHANHVVEHELEHRGLGDYLRHSNEWIDEHWYPFYEQQRASKWVEVLGPRRVMKRKK